MSRRSLTTPHKAVLATHWGLYRAERGGSLSYDLAGWGEDPDPTLLSDGLLESRNHPARIMQPCVRQSFMKYGPSARGRRGAEPFVAVDWDTAFDIVAREIARVRDEHGNQAIFGGSYGWSSAGRFHHAQSQVHRFLNCAGGYVRSVQNYSFAAGDVILPHVIGTTSGLAAGHTPWKMMAGETELLVLFGGAPLKNARVSAGGIARHETRDALRACRDAGAAIVNVSPVRSDVEAEFGASWIPIRPGTDTAFMLGLCHVLVSEGLHDVGFLKRATVGFEIFKRYLLGQEDGVPKTAQWAADICDVPSESITTLARRMAGSKTFIMVAWALQRASHGEQPYWMAASLAAALGNIGRTGEGVGFGYASSGGIGKPPNPFPWPSLPQGKNPVGDFIPVARISDMLLRPGQQFEYNGGRYLYPDIRLIYWAGGNPFHHHQDLNRLVEAWQRPEVVVVHEYFWNAHAKHADIVFPASMMFERNDIACSSRDRFIAASHKLFDPPPGIRTDYETFAGIAERLGVGDVFTEGEDEAGWVRKLYAQAQSSAAEVGQELPDFDAFWNKGVVEIPEMPGAPLLHSLRDPSLEKPLNTPSGKIEIVSKTIGQFGYDDCPKHPSWLPPTEWLGNATKEMPLHLLSNQPANRLHSQFDLGQSSQSSKVGGREPILINPEDAEARGISNDDLVKVHNARGALLASAKITDNVRRSVVQMSTGAWFDPSDPSVSCSLEKAGNPNVLTDDNGTSRLSQGPNANSCLVQVELYRGHSLPLTCYDSPIIISSN